MNISNSRKLISIFPKQRKVNRPEKQLSQKKNCAQSFKSRVKSIDIYGKKINLSYKGDDSFKTLPGAFSSLIVIFILLAYFAFRSYVLLSKSNPYLSKPTFLRHLLSEGEFKAMDYGFDIAFGINQELDPSIGHYQVNQVRYYYIDKYDANGNQIRIKDRIPLEVQRCGQEHFNYENQREILMYNIDDYQCIVRKNISLEGNFYSSKFSYIEIKLQKCQNSLNSKIVCKNQSQIDDFFEREKFNVALVNSIIDFNDYDQTKKSFIDDSIFWDIESDKYKKSNMYIQKQEANLQDDFLQLGQFEAFSFSQVSNIREYDDQYSALEGTLIALYLRFDYRYDVYN
ncbi:UNKNOWN [Stylonychia lemnae]|uniref:Transmembrane protein n=1 Tax=Stylonychia lemnae TaxID=5949 RepID=A0A077ZPI9_STYLE|nr:UNKNOWN [Stylonychia lemnae]|eukprot:CDW71369.1 UNKNOWN [Stylonychia lemnae]